MDVTSETEESENNGQLQCSGDLDYEETQSSQDDDFDVSIKY